MYMSLPILIKFQAPVVTKTLAMQGPPVDQIKYSKLNSVVTIKLLHLSDFLSDNTSMEGVQQGCLETARNTRDPSRAM